MIVVEDEGKPPIARKRYDWARGKRWFFESAYDVGRAPPPAKKARVQEAKKGARAPMAGRYKNNKK